MPANESGQKQNIAALILRKKEVGIALPTIFIVMIISFVNPVFISFENIMNISRTAAYVMMIGTSMTMVFISGGLDLSVGSVLALGGCVAGMALKAGVPIIVSILLGLLVGAVIGAINGMVIVKLNLPPIIVTLGTMYFARGLVQYLTRGTPVYPLPDYFNFLGQGYFWGTVPIVVVVALIAAVIAHITLSETAFGRSVYATGGNRETARLSGIRTNKVLAEVYILNGVMSALAGIFTAARLGSAQANAGTGMEMQVITAVVIGGTSTFGGSGSILGMAIGAFLMSIISNGMIIMKISVYVQAMVLGILIIFAVALDQYNRKRGGML
jgi:ribose/xylose/arabinose/galactoside ABC-type transport system permease subunit